MPQVTLGYASHKRRTTWNPQIRVVNMLAEKTETNPFNGIDHIQRPGLVTFSTLGPNPIQGVFRQAGTFDGDFLVAHGEELYRLNEAGLETYIGLLTGTGRFTAAATATRAVLASGGYADSTDGGTLTLVNMPDGRLVSSVAQLNGYFILPELDSARFYWTEPGQTDPDGLSFATTESSPGNILKVERVGDELWFFKEEGIEVWITTGDADLPFQRVPGRNYDKGARSKDAICRFDNSVAWVGNDGLVYRGDASPVRISDNTVEEQIRKSNDYRMWSFAFDGHSVLCLTLSQITFAYDAESQLWSEFKSYGYDYWRCHVGDSADTFVLAGDSETGVVYRLDPESSNDAGQPLERILTGSNPVLKMPERCDSFCVYTQTGTVEDPNDYPVMRVSWSDDLETYQDFEDVPLRRQGQYGEPVRLNRLGVMRYPGRLWRLQVTDDVVWTVSSASYNEGMR